MHHYLINKRHGIQTSERTIWLRNYISHTKVYFNEFEANALHDNMGVIIFDNQGCGVCQRPNTSYLGTHFGTLGQSLAHPTAPALLTKDSPRNQICYDSQHLFSLHISNSRTKPGGLHFQFPISLCRKAFAKEFNLHFNQTPVYFSHSKINVESKIFQCLPFQIRFNQITSFASFLNL